jgi:hypothetical protein
MARLLTVASLVMAFAVGPASATPPGPTPQGNSGVQEYQETIPSSDGSRPPSSGGGAGRNPSPSAKAGVRAGRAPAGSVLTRAQQRSLSRRGAYGRLTEELATATAPAQPRAGSRSSRAPSAAARTMRTDRAAASPQSVPLHRAVFNSAGAGMGMAALLLLLTLGAAVAAVAARRRSFTGE